MMMMVLFMLLVLLMLLWWFRLMVTVVGIIAIFTSDTPVTVESLARCQT